MNIFLHSYFVFSRELVREKQGTPDFSGTGSYLLQEITERLTFISAILFFIWYAGNSKSQCTLRTLPRSCTVRVGRSRIQRPNAPILTINITNIKLDLYFSTVVSFLIGSVLWWKFLMHAGFLHFLILDSPVYN